VFYFDIGLRLQETFYGIKKSAVYLQPRPFHQGPEFTYECWNFNSGNYLFTTDTK